MCIRKASQKNLRNRSLLSPWLSYHHFIIVMFISQSRKEKKERERLEKTARKNVSSSKAERSEKGAGQSCTSRAGSKIGPASPNALPLENRTRRSKKHQINHTTPNQTEQNPEIKKNWHRRKKEKGKADHPVRNKAP